MNSEVMDISNLIPNEGQIEGVPENPRDIKNEDYKKLKKSLQEDPEMLELREVIAYDNDGELVVIMGNQRLFACRELGLREIPVKVLPKETPAKKLRAYSIKDNVNYGDFDSLKLEEWDEQEREEWGAPVEKKDEDKTAKGLNRTIVELKFLKAIEQGAEVYVLIVP